MTYDNWKTSDGATDPCPHGNHPDDCPECEDERIEAEYEKADRDLQWEREHEEKP